jgi:hypothetical protein
MFLAVTPSLFRHALACHLLVLLIATAIALLSAHNFAGGWNDGSRLATVECLVDYHTLSIDRSIFVEVPPHMDPSMPAPYPADDPGLLQNGTGDKLLIGGHFYSDKSPVPALLMAGVYQGLQWATGLKARERPDLFCYWMTVCSSGIAYVVAVWCVYRLGGLAMLSPPWQLMLTASFALCTVALPYVRHVNNHIILLGIVAGLMLGLMRLGAWSVERGPWSLGLSSERSTPHAPRLTLLGLGTLAGLGYATDLGVGPVLVLCTILLVGYRCRRASSLAMFGLAMLPWLVLHHAVNYAVGGTWKPANAVPEYFEWPGCSFNPNNMTGTWNHENFVHFLTYAGSLLVGKRGFWGHDPALYLVLPALVILLRRWIAEWPELVFAGALSGGTWLIYAITSNNSSGLCCSIRWFVPLLALAYYVLAVFLSRFPGLRWIFLILSGWGAVLGGLMWWKGPWMQHMVPYYWPLQGAALVSLAFVWIRRRKSANSVTAHAIITDQQIRAA